MASTTDYPIESGVPIPAKRVSIVTRAPKYRFGDMSVGDSFAVPVGTEKSGSNYVSALRLTSAATNYKRRHPGSGWDFTVRTLTAEGIVRLWRTA